MLSKIDQFIIRTLQKIWRPLAKISIFIIFFYFGFLKVLGLSPANPLVSALLQQTIDFVPFEKFVILWGFFEMLIGLTFITPRLERIAIFLLLLHMIIVALPLILLPQITWQKFLVPTLEGQYIIKNLAIISLALVIGAHLEKRKMEK
jgi:uncharacterized membrane protein YkgB